MQAVLEAGSLSVSSLQLQMQQLATQLKHCDTIVPGDLTEGAFHTRDATHEVSLRRRELQPLLAHIYCNLLRIPASPSHDMTNTTAGAQAQGSTWNSHDAGKPMLHLEAALKT